jgi:response regulator RpfG family c-di-GMP phosphodiesterase
MEDNYRALIVDDDTEVRETLGQILSEIGKIEVDSVGDGEAGFSLLKERDFDLVFIDIRLPGMDGLELLRLIKRHSPALTVVMITGFPSVDGAIQSMKDGASDFITKPFRFQQIEHVIEKQLFHRARTVKGKLAESVTPRDRPGDAIDVKLNSKIKELSILYSISESMAPTDFDVDRFYEKIVEMASTVTGAERTSLMILDRETNELRIKAAKGLSQEIVGSVRVPLGSGVSGRVVTSGKPLLVKNSRSSSIQTGKKNYRTESYVSIPLTIKGETFGVLNVTDKGDGSHFDEGEALLLLNLMKRAALNIENSLLYETLYNSLVDTLQCLVSTLEAKDHYTQRHSERVTAFAVRIAGEMSCAQEEIESIRFAGLLHDIGKIGIHDAVLQKAGGLTEKEFSLVKTHPIVGENIIRPLGLLPMETTIVRNHHERWDGAGYPDGLSKQDIPLLARILAVADAYDAMTSDRPYRTAKTGEEAIDELKRCTGSQFDKNVVEAFLRLGPLDAAPYVTGQLS